MVDLWPEQITTEKIKAPVAILREQASLLGQKTKNLVKAEVDTPRQRNESFHYDFDLVAPTLDNYHYRLFSVEHGIDLYPLSLRLDENIAEELEDQVEPSDCISILVETEDKLLEKLRFVFGSKRTIHLIKALLAQAEPASQIKPVVSDEIPF